MNYALYQPSEANEIIELFNKTFSDSEGDQEGQMVSGLVEILLNTTPEQDIFVFVAKQQQTVVASILFTRLAFEQQQASFLMAPVAVHTDYQGQGIGQALIRHGLDAMRSKGTKIAFTYGDPNFYSKVGFKQVTEQQFKAPQTLSFPHGWMAQSLTDEKIDSLAGQASCVEGFNNPALW